MTIRDNTARSNRININNSVIVATVDSTNDSELVAWVGREITVRADDK